MFWQNVLVVYEMRCMGGKSLKLKSLSITGYSYYFFNTEEVRTFSLNSLAITVTFRRMTKSADNKKQMTILPLLKQDYFRTYRRILLRKKKQNNLRHSRRVYMYHTTIKDFRSLRCSIVLLKRTTSSAIAREIKEPFCQRASRKKYIGQNIVLFTSVLQRILL